MFLTHPEPIESRVLWQSTPQGVHTHQSCSLGSIEAHSVHEDVLRCIASVGWIWQFFRMALQRSRTTEFEVPLEARPPHASSAPCWRCRFHERLCGDYEKICNRNETAPLLVHALERHIRGISLMHVLKHTALQASVVGILEIDASIGASVIQPGVVIHDVVPCQSNEASGQITSRTSVVVASRWKLAVMPPHCTPDHGVGIPSSCCCAIGSQWWSPSITSDEPGWEIWV